MWHLQFRRAFLLAGCALVASGPWLGSLLAGESVKGQKHRQAEQWVQEALHREIYDLNAERQQLLERAVEQDASYAPAHWHLGHVWHQNQWIPADQLAYKLADDQRIKLYEGRRAECGETAADHFVMANWCRENGLPLQERAHLMRVISLQDDHAGARGRLGFRQVGGEWVTREQVDQGLQQQRDLAQALNKWRPRMLELRNQLRQRSQLKREAAAAAISQLSDPEAIPALEAELSPESEQAALFVIAALDKMSDHQATMSLARHAVMHPSDSVRVAAGDALRGRDLDAFVPELLATLTTPVETRVDVVRNSQGRLVYRHSFLRESQDQRELMVLDTEYERVSRPGGNGGETLQRAVQDAANRALQRQATVWQQNWNTAVMNQRIADALNYVTQQQLPAAPRQWWSWWNDYNEVYIEGEKPLRTFQDREEVTIADSAPSFSTGSGGSSGGSGGPPQRSDCLAAGTLVWTSTGTRPIEEMQVGDLVLSQDPDSGELAYQPVLQTTVRPLGKLVRIEVDEETFETSGGHLFWVSGEGWMKARDLKSGMLLHTRDGAVHVVDVTEGSSQVTYNLVVDQFNTYFVGSSRVLNHDNTVCEPTEAVVPGLH